MGNGENVKRESYVRTPEYEAALETLPAGEGRGNERASGGFCVCPGETKIH